MELKHFDRVLNPNIRVFSDEGIQSDGYVVHSLEAAMWCFFTTETYKDCVLKAVNLGNDTDTVAAIAGGLAGVYYGLNNIPREWVDNIVKVDFIMGICRKFQNKL